MDKRTLVNLAAGAIGVFLFLWLVFPTPYEYTRKYPNVVRVNRFTGVRERASPKGWVPDTGASLQDIKALDDLLD